MAVAILIKAAQSYPDRAPWYVLAPGICIFAVVLALNTLGDVLRDRLDPRLRRLKKEFAMPLSDRLAAGASISSCATSTRTARPPRRTRSGSPTAACLRRWR